MSTTPVPVGNDFQVNTFTTAAQLFPSAAALAGGGFVVVWTSLNQDGSAYGIYGQRYAANGLPALGEFRVNSTTADWQTYSSVAALADGGYVVTWSSSGQDGSGNGIYGQRYAANGTAVQGEFRINSVTSSDQHYSTVTALADGGFVVTWTSSGQDGGGTGIYGQRYAANGAAVLGEFRVNTVTTDQQDFSSVTALADGGFVVTWSSIGQDGSGYGIYGQRYAANGATVSGEFRVNTVTSGTQNLPSVTALADGGFVVTWSSSEQDGSGTGIYGQRYAANGTALLGEFRVNTVTTSDQVYPSVTALADGGFVVTWSSSGPGGSGYDIFGQRYASNGTASGSEFLVNQVTSGHQVADSMQGSPTVVTLADGRLVQVWSVNEGEIFYRMIDVPAQGSPSPLASVAALSSVKAEGNGGATAFTFTVTMDGDAFATRSVAWAVGGSAAPSMANGADFAGGVLPAGILTFAPGETSKVLTVSVAGDSAVEPDEAFFVALSNPSPGWKVGSGPASGTIQNDDFVVGTPVPVGNDVQVNTYATGEQSRPSMAALAGGGFVVTWNSFNQDGSDGGVYGQRYAANGLPALGEFRINTTTASLQYEPSVAALAGGGFVVTWLSDEQDGSDFGIYGQRYGANGAAVSGEFRVNTVTVDGQLYPSVTGLADGGFVVTWTSYWQDGSSSGIYGQRYSANGTAVGSEFRVNTFTLGHQDGSTVTALADGGFVVTWASWGDGHDGDGWGVYAQRYAADGTALLGEFRVNTFTSSHQYGAMVTALADGGFVVTWTSLGQDGSGYSIYGQRYAANGTAVLGEFRVNAYTSDDQAGSSVTALADGGFVITWSSKGQDGSGAGVYGQRYASDGTALGSEFLINQVTSGDQAAGALVTLADGRLVQVWAGSGVEEVFHRLVEIPAAPLAAHDDAYLVKQGEQLSFAAPGSVLWNDQSAATASLLDGPDHGTLQLAGNGTFTYTPAAGFHGIDTFTYQAGIVGPTMAEAQVTIHVVPVSVGPTSTTLNLVGLTAEEQVASTYVAFFGRGADAGGFAFWLDQFEVGLPTRSPAVLFADIASSHAISPEAKALYPFLAGDPFKASDGQIVDFLEGVYGNLFNRLPDEDGLTYWTGQVKQTLESGRFVGSVLVDIMSGAQDTAAAKDITTLMGKVAVSVAYVREQQEHETPWLPGDIAAAKGLLETVTAEPASVLVGVRNAEILIASHA